MTPTTGTHRPSRVRQFIALLRQTFTEWSDDKVPTYAASLAYYTVFSLAPTLLIALAIAGFVFGEEAARGALQTQLNGIIGESTAQTVQDAMANASRQGAGILATIIGVVVLVFAATGVFAELQGALNTVWKVKPQKTSGVLAYLRTRFLSLAVVLGIGFLLLVSLVVSALLSAFGGWMGTFMPGWKVVGNIINLLVSFGVITVLFAMMFKLLPNRKLAWRDVWLGAGVSSLLFAIGKYFIALYLTKSAVASSYGAAGSLAALLVWVYYSSMTMLFGAELAQVFARRHGTLASEPPAKAPTPAPSPGYRPSARPTPALAGGPR